MKIFVNGTFDILHKGHIDLLRFAKSRGSFLLVAVDTDIRVSEKKGPDRPVNNLENRVEVLKSIRYINEVKSFGSDEELTAIIKDFLPDIMVVGSDWKNNNVIGSQYAKQLIFFDRIKDYSTTKTIENFVDRRQLCR